MLYSRPLLASLLARIETSQTQEDAHNDEEEGSMRLWHRLGCRQWLVGPSSLITALCVLHVDLSCRINTGGTRPDVDMTDVSRGIFGGGAGIDRILKLLRKYNITATFFVPAHTAESF